MWWVVIVVDTHYSQNRQFGVALCSVLSYLPCLRFVTFGLVVVCCPFRRNTASTAHVAIVTTPPRHRRQHHHQWSCLVPRDWSERDHSPTAIYMTTQPTCHRHDLCLQIEKWVSNTNRKSPSVSTCPNIIPPEKSWIPKFTRTLHTPKLVDLQPKRLPPPLSSSPFVVMYCNQQQRTRHHTTSYIYTRSAVPEGAIQLGALPTTVSPAWNVHTCSEVSTVPKSL